jgi:EAL domain-containing protein (putative c-di-GMP-specific phosphodiesterase class I)
VAEGVEEPKQLEMLRRFGSESGRAFFSPDGNR